MQRELRHAFRAARLVGRAVFYAILVSIGLLSMAGASGAQAEPRLLITELYYDTPGIDGDEEWLEVANIGEAPLSLDGIKVGDEEHPGGAEGMMRFPPGATLGAHGVAVVAQTATGFRALFGINPDFELRDSDSAVSDMLPYEVWASGGIALNNDGDELLLLDADDFVIDAISYGDSTVFFSPSILKVSRGQSLVRVPANCDTDGAGDWQPASTPTPGAIDVQDTCPSLALGDDRQQAVTIGVIQGNGARSPLINEIVRFEGVVTGMLEDQNARGAIFYTLFVQEMTGNGDGDAATSDAIAVFHGPRRPPYLPGDVVRVTGQVTEFYGFTEIDDSGLRIELVKTDHPLPAAKLLVPPMDGDPAYYEALEAMRVVLPEAVVVGPTFTGCGLAVVAGATPRRFLRQQLADDAHEIVPVLHHSDVSCGDFPQVKVGDVLYGLQGPMVYHFDQFKVVHQFPGELRVAPSDLPLVPSMPQPGANEASIATFNFHDHFDAIDDRTTEDEPMPSADDVRVKEAKLGLTIAQELGCPTLLAVQEVENERLLQSLAQQLEPTCEFHYMVVHRESVDARGIDLGLLTDARRVQVTAVNVEQHCSAVTTGLPEINIDCPAGQEPLFSRPPLQVDLLLDDEPYTMVVTHFKSKREGEQETSARRLAQAAAVAELVQQRLDDDPEARIIVLGDFNDYELSPVMQALTTDAVGLLNTAYQIPLEERYTYNFGGVSQLLDAILVSPALAPRLVASTIVHVNADFPAGWATDPQTLFRSSDHDVPFIILRTGLDGAETLPTAPATPRQVETPAGSTVPPTAPTAVPSFPTDNGDATARITKPFVVLALTLGLLFAGAMVVRWRRSGQHD